MYLPYLAHFLSIYNWPVCCEGGLGMCGNRKVGWWFQWSYYLVSRQPQQHMWKYWWLQIILTLSLLETFHPHTHLPSKNQHKYKVCFNYPGFSYPDYSYLVPFFWYTTKLCSFHDYDVVYYLLLYNNKRKEKHVLL